MLARGYDFTPTYLGLACPPARPDRSRDAQTKGKPFVKRSQAGTEFA